MNKGVVRMIRVGSCAALLALLAVCGYAGASQMDRQMASVPVMVETMDQLARAAVSMQETASRLEGRRAQALAELQAVIDDPQASLQTRNAALLEKTRLAVRMEKEASSCAVLSHMGFGEAAVVMGENEVSVIVPQQAGENEQNRMQIMDAVVTQTGFSADCVKIILSKK